MLRTIYVPLDGSPLAERALPYAERLAHSASARLVLSRVVPLNIIEPAEDDLALADEARKYLERIATRLTPTSLVIETMTAWGDPAALILEQVRSSHVDLIVMGTHGRSGPGRWLYGSVADAVLRGAPVPVVLVPPAAISPWPAERLNRVLVPLDGSTLAEAALTPAQELANTFGAEIVLLEVVPFPPYSLYDNGSSMAAFEPDVELAQAEQYLSGVAARLKATGIQVRVRADLAQPTVAIAAIAGQETADLILMATHGRSGFARLVLGSVATGTLQRSGVPLLLVGPSALQHQASPREDEPAAAVPVG